MEEPSSLSILYLTMSTVTLLVLSLIPFTIGLTSPQIELFSSDIASKVSNTGSNFSREGWYPEYTDSSVGQWQYFPTDTWTTGFFPSMLYALNTRTTLCQSDSNLKSVDWLGLARNWASLEVQLETTNTLGHDVGFVSFPFQEELKL